MNVAIIPARGGSRRIPRKNIRMFHGKPIIGYSIEAAQTSGLFKSIYVSTDDEEIRRVAWSCGAPTHMRSSEMAKDEVGTQDVMAQALRELIDVGAFFASLPKFVCCIYPCAPMLTPETLRAAFTLLTTSGCNYVVPVGTWLRDPGQFYFGRADAFLACTPLLGVNTRLLPIKPEIECDINIESDWTRAERMYAELKGRIAA